MGAAHEVILKVLFQKSNMNELITILTFTYIHELAVAQGLLESEGVETFLKDEFVASVNPLYSNAIGGIKLQVNADDVERATIILREAGFIKEENNGT